MTEAMTTEKAKSFLWWNENYWQHYILWWLAAKHQKITCTKFGHYCTVQKSRIFDNLVPIWSSECWITF